MASVKNLDEYAREVARRAVEEITICGHPFLDIVEDIVQGRLIYRKDVLDKIADHEKWIGTENVYYNLAHEHLAEVVQMITFPPEGERPTCGPEKCEAARRYAAISCERCRVVRKEGQE